MTGAGPSRHAMCSPVHDTDKGDAGVEHSTAVESNGSVASSAQPLDHALPHARHWPPRLYLAVDCGGTKSAAAICDESGDIVGRGQGGPSNYTDNGLVPFLASVQEAVKNALQDLRNHYQNVSFVYDGVRLARREGKMEARQMDDVVHDEQKNAVDETASPSTVADALAYIRPSSLPREAPSLTLEAAWLGIAGVDSPTDVATLSPHVGAMLGIPYPSPRLVVANDTSLLASPIADTFRSDIKSGVVVIAGTGSIVMSFRRRKNGMLKVLGRIGGFGWLLGDEGSGYAVGRSAVRQVLDVADRERLCADKSNVQSIAGHDEDESGSDDDDDDDNENQDAACGNDHNTEAVETQNGLSSSASDRTPMDDAHIFRFEEFHAANHNIDTRDRQTQDTDYRPRASRLPPSPPPSARASTMAVRSDAVHSSDRRPYGYALRDRILQHWDIASTDELLGAVYYDDTVKSGGMERAERRSDVQDGHREATADSLIAEKSATRPLGDPSDLSRSDHTLRNGEATLLATRAMPGKVNQMDATSLLTLPEASATANLLPPSAATLDADTYVKATSPIPSLSSSPTSSTTAPSEVGSSIASNSASASPHFRPRAGSAFGDETRRLTPARPGSGQGNGSAADTDATSAASSLGVPNMTTTKMTHASALKHASSQRRRHAKAERKHRLAALAPIVFHLAFAHEDAMSLDILRTQAHAISLQIRDIVQPGRHALAHLTPSTSVLCLGGSLVGVERYRDLLVDELAGLGVRFARIEFVGDAARRGAVALSHVIEGQRRAAQPSHSAAAITSSPHTSTSTTQLTEQKTGHGSNHAVPGNGSFHRTNGKRMQSTLHNLFPATGER